MPLEWFYNPQAVNPKQIGEIIFKIGAIPKDQKYFAIVSSISPVILPFVANNSRVFKI